MCEQGTLLENGIKGGCDTEEWGQWAQRGGLGLELGFLELFSNLSDSMILHSVCVML